jgi:perosamine synthetase
VRAALVGAYADGSWGRYHGPYGERLRTALAEMHSLAHTWTCSSGTVAVELALRGLKVGPGDEVILAAYDFPGNFRAIEAVGARPVLVDLTPGTWTLDVNQIEGGISATTRAVLASHMHGSLVAMPTLRELCDRHGLSIVEDACQVPGAMVAGKPAGAWGDCGVLSFGGSKLLTAGRGGAVVTDRDDVIQRIKIFCERGNDAFPLSELQAAVLLPQLGKLTAANNTRLAAVRRLLAACHDLPRLSALRLPTDEADEPAFYKFPFRLTAVDADPEAPHGTALRQRFIDAMKAEGVALDEGFRGFARRTNQRCRVVGELIHARRAAAGTVVLHHPVLLEPPETIDRLAGALHKVASAVLLP